MNARKRRAEARQIVLERGIPDAIGFEALVGLVEDYRGTQIRFFDNPALNGERVCGAWTGMPGVDTIHLPADAKTEVKLFIACHEFGHMLSEPVGEEIRVGDSEEIRDFLRSVLNPDRVVAYAFRGARTLDDAREATAEGIGDQLALRILKARRLNATRDFKFERVFAG